MFWGGCSYSTVMIKCIEEGTDYKSTITQLDKPLQPNNFLIKFSFSFPVKNSQLLIVVTVSVDLTNQSTKLPILPHSINNGPIGLLHVQRLGTLYVEQIDCQDVYMKIWILFSKFFSPSVLGHSHRLGGLFKYNHTLSDSLERHFRCSLQCFDGTFTCPVFIVELLYPRNPKISLKFHGSENEQMQSLILHRIHI